LPGCGGDLERALIGYRRGRVEVASQLPDLDGEREGVSLAGELAQA
jgi:hypothetical protein